MTKMRWTQEEYDQLMRLKAQGVPYPTIARALGRTATACKDKALYGMGPGAVRAPSPMRVFHLQRALPPHIWSWLEKSVPEGGTLTELVAAIITDAYRDEVGQ